MTVGRSNRPYADQPPIRKSLGQHFLSDPRILTRIAEALAPDPTETVVEIGPGRGALTDELIRRARRVIAIELDRALAARLRERYAGDARVSVIEEDVLRVDMESVTGGEYALVGNVPYYITTPIIFRSLEPPRASRAVFLLQREVADRLTAPPGGREYGALSVNVQAVATAEVLFGVPAGAFHPPPKVESAVVRLTPRVDPVIPVEAEDRFRAFVQAAFGLRRKQMRRVLRTILQVDASEADGLLRAAEIPADVRPETLSPAQFARLVQAVGAG